MWAKELLGVDPVACNTGCINIGATLHRHVLSEHMGDTVLAPQMRIPTLLLPPPPCMQVTHLLNE